MSDSDSHNSSYVYTWLLLVVLLGLSLVAAMLNKVVALSVIFAVAVFKAAIVCGNFMHLRMEPRWLTGVVLFAVIVLAIFWFGVAPDIVMVPLVVAK
ncbi:cytochrome C oxidase subunit IV family protein [bacterium]|nr:cytochrome C oxidase subunit IV family protein [bacterium]